MARRCQKFCGLCATRRRLRRSLPKPLRRRRHHRRPPSKPHRRRRRRPPWSTTRRRHRHRRRPLPKRRRRRRRRRPLPSRPRHRHRRLDRRPQAAARARLGPASSAATTSSRASIRGWSSSTSASASATRTGLTSPRRDADRATMGGVRRALHFRVGVGREHRREQLERGVQRPVRGDAAGGEGDQPQGVQQAKELDQQRHLTHRARRRRHRVRAHPDRRRRVVREGRSDGALDRLGQHDQPRHRPGHRAAGNHRADPHERGVPRAVLQHNRRGQGLLRRRCGLVVRWRQRRPGRRHRRGVGPVCPHRHSQLRRLQLPREAGRPDARVSAYREWICENIAKKGTGTAAPPTFCAGIGDGGGGEGLVEAEVLAAETRERSVRGRAREQVVQQEGVAVQVRERGRQDCEGLRAHVRPLHPRSSTLRGSGRSQFHGGAATGDGGGAVRRLPSYRNLRRQRGGRRPRLRRHGAVGPRWILRVLARAATRR